MSARKKAQSTKCLLLPEIDSQMLFAKHERNPETHKTMTHVTYYNFTSNLNNYFSLDSSIKLHLLHADFCFTVLQGCT